MAKAFTRLGELEQLYTTTKIPILTLARYFNVTRKTIDKYIKKYGWKRPAHSPIVEAVLKSRAQEIYENGRGLTTIVAELKLPIDLIRKWKAEGEWVKKGLTPRKNTVHPKNYSHKKKELT